MRATRIPVAVEFERVPVASRWADSRWQPSRVVPVDRDPDTVDESAVERLDAEGVLERWRFPGQTTEMHAVESEGYYLNLSAPDPMAFVMWRHRDDGEPPVHPVVVTLSYNEAARMMDGGEQAEPGSARPAPARDARAVRGRELQARAEAQAQAERPVRRGCDAATATATAARRADAAV